MYKFMQIYGNCTAIHCLGDTRIRGPVDNVIAKGKALLEILLYGDYIKYLRTHTPIITPHEPSFVGDHLFAYDYKIVQFLHNDPTTEKSQIELKKRLQNFKSFKEKVLTDKNYYFIYTINDYDLNKDTHKMNLDIFCENLKLLKKEKLLNKTIFVETKNDDPAAFWNFYATNIKDVIKKYNLKYIQINNITKGAADQELIVPQFYTKAIAAIQKANLKTTPKKKKMKSSYLGYQGSSSYFGL